VFEVLKGQYILRLGSAISDLKPMQLQLRLFEISKDLLPAWFCQIKKSISNQIGSTPVYATKETQIFRLLGRTLVCTPPTCWYGHNILRVSIQVVYFCIIHNNGSMEAH